MLTRTQSLIPWHSFALQFKLLSKPQLFYIWLKQLLWYCWVRHISMNYVLSLLQNSCSEELCPITPSNNKASHNHQPLSICPVYQYAKQTYLNPLTNTRALPSFLLLEASVIMYLNLTNMCQWIYVASPDWLPDTFCKEKPKSKSTDNTIFVDHSSCFIFNKHQHSTIITEPVPSKYSFEDHYSSIGFKIQEYVTDNNPFHRSDLTTDCTNQQQRRHFSVVGAHYKTI